MQQEEFLFLERESFKRGGIGNKGQQNLAVFILKLHQAIQIKLLNRYVYYVSKKSGLFSC
jgi:hypothetical protein